MTSGDITFNELTPKTLTFEMFEWLRQKELQSLIPSLKQVTSFASQQNYILNSNKSGDYWYIISGSSKDLGFVKCRSMGNNSFMFSLMITDSCNRRQGIGYKAYTHCLQKLAKNHHSVILFAEVLANNEPSISFFKKLGFTEKRSFKARGYFQLLFEKKVEFDK